MAEGADIEDSIVVNLGNDKLTVNQKKLLITYERMTGRSPHN